MSGSRDAIWSNVTARPHESANPELLRKRLVEQLVSPVRWAQSCANLLEAMASVLHPDLFGTSVHVRRVQ